MDDDVARREERVDEVLGRIQRACRNVVSFAYLAAKQRGDEGAFLERMIHRCSRCTFDDCAVRGVCRYRDSARN